MVCYFIGVYIINRTLHGRLEIRNFSSRVEKKYHTSERSQIIFYKEEKQVEGSLFEANQMRL